jgi:hypothetical protein
MRRIGVLTPFATDDPAGQRRVLAFAQALAQLGWIDAQFRSSLFGPLAS